MDKQELKKALREQCAPFAESVRKKIEYLQSDDVFLAEEDKALQTDKDLSLEEAFDMAMLSEPSVTTFEDPLSGALTQPSVPERPLAAPNVADFQSSPSSESSSVFDMFQGNNIPAPLYAESSGDVAARQQNIQEHKQNIAAKIAALRGISVPSAYINKKN